MTAQASARSDAGEGPVVETAHGPVRGFDDGTVKVWKAVRYAAPPVGDLRWRAPEPPKSWSEPVDARRVGPVCPQPTDPRIPIDLGAPGSANPHTVVVFLQSEATHEIVAVSGTR